MSQSKYNLLIARLNLELKNLEKTVEKATSQVSKAQNSGDEDFYDAAALNLQNYYMGVERILLEIAREIDAYVPQGSNWHKQLLQQMSIENGDVRPAVLSLEVMRSLSTDYLGFRHVTSHLYAFELKHDRIRDLVNTLPNCQKLLEKDIQNYCQYLQVLASKIVI